MLRKILPTFIVAALALSAAHAGEKEHAQMPAATINVPTLTQDAAEKIVAAARKKAEATDSGVYKAKTKMHVYVLGREGTLMAGTQALGAWPGSADIAMKKARTAWLFKLPTRTIGNLSRTDMKDKAPLYGIEHSNGGLISFPGGLPIFDEAGALVGSIGVSGDTVDNDEAVAQAGVDEAKKLGKDAVTQLPSLSQQSAAYLLHKAVAKAAETDSAVYAGKKTKMHVYVLGREGTVLAATQADDAWPGSADIALRKAKTSWHFKLPTGTIGDLSRLDKEAKAPLYRIEHSNDGLITFPGGLPVFDANGEFVGALGVSGDSVEKDHAVAQAGVDAFADLLKAANK